jgi:hypothetical protein
MATVQALARKHELAHQNLMVEVRRLATQAGIDEDDPAMQRLAARPSVTQPLATQVEQMEGLVDILSQIDGNRRRKTARSSARQEPTAEQEARPERPRGASAHLPAFVGTAEYTPPSEHGPSMALQPSQPGEGVDGMALMKLGGTPKASRSLVPGAMSDHDAEIAHGRPPMTEFGPLGAAGTPSLAELDQIRANPDVELGDVGDDLEEGEPGQEVVFTPSASFEADVAKAQDQEAGDESDQDEEEGDVHADSDEEEEEGDGKAANKTSSATPRRTARKAPGKRR